MKCERRRRKPRARWQKPDPLQGAYANLGAEDAFEVEGARGELGKDVFCSLIKLQVVYLLTSDLLFPAGRYTNYKYKIAQID